MSGNLRLIRYESMRKDEWDEFVRNSRNGTFLFERDYMDYHSGRFEDSSLIVVDEKRVSNIIAVLPANLTKTENKKILRSHEGLSYGGWLVNNSVNSSNMLRIFDLLMSWASHEGIHYIRYKVIPTIYHRQPTQEDIYALFRHKATLSRVDLASVVNLRNPIPWSKGKAHGVSLARRNGLGVRRSRSYEKFMALLSNALARHNARPVHDLFEIELLANRFPEKIRLYEAFLGSEQSADPLACVLIFDKGAVVHTQYMANSPEGRKVGALDLIIHHLQTVEFKDRQYLSFGISTENNGKILNEGLTQQKEMFCGRGITHLHYDLAVG